MKTIKAILVGAFWLMALLYIAPIIIVVIVTEAYAAHKASKQPEPQEEWPSEL